MQPRNLSGKGSGKGPDAPQDPSAALDELEADIEALRVAYDKFFTGVERIAPTRARERLERKLRLSEGVAFKTTALRFRNGALRARFVTYAQYWTRVLDQIERGVWRRDASRGRVPDESPTTAESVAVPTPIASEPSMSGAGVIDPEHAREVFDKLVAAKRSLGESVDGLTFPAFLRKLHREAPRLAAQSGIAAIRFDVDVKDGKARIRARAGA